MKLKLLALATASALALATHAYAAAPPNISQTVGVCDPNSPQHCVKPDVNGAIPVTGSFTPGGNTVVVGPTADGSPSTTAPVQIAGTSDGTSAGNVDVVKVDPAGNLAVNNAQVAGTAVSTGNGTTDGGTQRVTLSSDSTGQVKLAAGTAVIGHVITDTGSTTAVTGTVATNDASNVAQGSTTAGQSGPLQQCAVTTAAPTYTTAQTDPLSCAIRGGLRVALYNGANEYAQNSAQNDGLSVNNLALVAVSVPYVYDTTNNNFNRTRQASNAPLTGVGVTATAPVPCSATSCGVTGSATTAVASSLVLKASAGNLYYVNVVAGASAGFVMFFNATAAPADGAVTPAYCMPLAANAGFNMANTPLPTFWTTGIVVVFSSTGCFAKTASATAFISGAAQ